MKDIRPKQMSAMITPSVKSMLGEFVDKVSASDITEWEEDRMAIVRLNNSTIIHDSEASMLIQRLLESMRKAISP